MSRRNGDRARFQKDRKRRVLKRQRTQQLLLSIRSKRSVATGSEGKAPKQIG